MKMTYYSRYVMENILVKLYLRSIVMEILLGIILMVYVYTLQAIYFWPLYLENLFYIIQDI